MKAERIAIYPYRNELFPIIQYCHVLKHMKIQYILSPYGYGWIGHSVKVEDKEWIVQEKIDSTQCKELDRIWIASTAEQLDTNTLYSFVEGIAKINLPMWISADFPDEVRNKIIEINQRYHNTAEFMKEESLHESEGEDSAAIETPMIAVFGIGEMTQKCDLQLYLRRYFQEELKVCQITAGKDGKALGMHGFPEFMTKHEWNEKEKIGRFRNWIRQLENEEKPDVIILGIPGGIIPLNEKHTFDYGVLAYEVFCAVKPDYSILSLYAGKYTDTFYEEMRQLCKYRYNFELDSYFIARYTPMSNSMMDDLLNYTELKEIKKEESNYTVFDNNDLEDDTLYAAVLQTLMLYARFESV